jgi:PIN domain nuclease of toxin-antitoxin system
VTPLLLDTHAFLWFVFELAHLIAYDRLPLLHRDPFDRILVAQAKVLGIPVVTLDPAFRAYDVAVLW